MGGDSIGIEIGLGERDEREPFRSEVEGATIEAASEGLGLFALTSPIPGRLDADAIGGGREVFDPFRPGEEDDPEVPFEMTRLRG